MEPRHARRRAVRAGVPAGGGHPGIEELVGQSIELPGGELRLLQPRAAAELPDAGAVEWAPLAPYWSVLWRSGVALARELDGVTLAARNARANAVRIETATVDWREPGELVERAPFDLVLAADVLYERSSVAPLLSLLPRLAPEVWLANPGRPAADAFVEEARRRWEVDTRARGVVQIHRLRLT